MKPIPYGTIAGLPGIWIGPLVIGIGSIRAEICTTEGRTNSMASGKVIGTFVFPIAD